MKFKGDSQQAGSRASIRAMPSCEHSSFIVSLAFPQLYRYIILTYIIQLVLRGCEWRGIPSAPQGIRNALRRRPHGHTT